MNTQPTTPVSYCVEMSGWDVNENFFVEKTELKWTEEEKKVHLQHPIRQGAVVFVRLTGVGAQEKVMPVAYKTATVTYRMQLGCYDVSLMQMLPRMNNGEPAEAPHE